MVLIGSRSGLAAIWMTALLSQKIETGSSICMLNSLNKFVTQTISTIKQARLLYSVSVKLLETIACFLYFHEIWESPNFNRYHVTDHLVLGHDALYASQ